MSRGTLLSRAAGRQTFKELLTLGSARLGVDYSQEVLLVLTRSERSWEVQGNIPIPLQS